MPDKRHTRTPAAGVPALDSSLDGGDGVVMDESGEAEAKTPPIYGVADPVVHAELKKLWHEVQRVGKNVHGVRNQLAVHHGQDEAAFARVEEHMEEQKKGAEKRTGRLWGLVGVAVAVFSAVIAAWIAVRSDITDLRARQDNLRERVESIDKTLDKVDDKLDRALSRGVRPDAAP